MFKFMTFMLALCASISLAAQTGANQPANSDQGQSKKHKDEVTVRGCVSKQNSDYILMQTDPGNAYQLEKSRNLHLAHYLGKEVEVTGRESPSMATSSDYLARSGVASPVTIRIRTIKTIAERCGAN
ncbi:MAG TPA: hypothetical protein VMB18_15305 [Terriglobales bacterium]|nr:hypothetical protein [Terriglobales bacterium]